MGDPEKHILRQQVASNEARMQQDMKQRVYGDTVDARAAHILLEKTYWDGVRTGAGVAFAICITFIVAILVIA